MQSKLSFDKCEQFTIREEISYKMLILHPTKMMKTNPMHMLERLLNYFNKYLILCLMRLNEICADEQIEGNS